MSQTTKKSKMENPPTSPRPRPPSPPTSITPTPSDNSNTKKNLHPLISFSNSVSMGNNYFSMDIENPEKSILNILILCSSSEKLLKEALLIYTSLPEVSDVNLLFGASANAKFSRGITKESSVKWRADYLPVDSLKRELGLGIEIQKGMNFNSKFLYAPIVVWLYFLVRSDKRTSMFAECVDVICRHKSFRPEFDTGEFDNVLSFVIRYTPTEYRKNIARDLSPLIEHPKMLPYLNGEKYKDTKDGVIKDVYTTISDMQYDTAIPLLEKIIDIGIEVRKLNKSVLHTFLGNVILYKFLDKKGVHLNYNDKDEEDRNVLQSILQSDIADTFGCNNLIYVLKKTGFDISFSRKMKEVIINGGNLNMHFGDEKLNLLMAIAKFYSNKEHDDAKTYSYPRLIMGLIEYFHKNKQLAYTDLNGRNVLYYLQSDHNHYDYARIVIEKGVIDLDHKDNYGETFADYLYITKSYRNGVYFRKHIILDYDFITDNCTFFNKNDPNCLSSLAENLSREESEKTLLIAFRKGVDIFQECKFLDQSCPIITIFPYETCHETSGKEEKGSMKYLSPFSVFISSFLKYSKKPLDIEIISSLITEIFERPKGFIDFTRIQKIFIYGHGTEMTLGSIILMICMIFIYEEGLSRGFLLYYQRDDFLNSHSYHELIHNSKLLLTFQEHNLGGKLLQSLTRLTPSQEILCERNIKYVEGDCEIFNLFELFFHNCKMDDKSNEFLFFARRMIPLTHYVNVFPKNDISVYNKYNSFRQLILARMFDEGSIAHNMPLDIWRIFLFEAGMWQFLTVHEIEKDRELRSLEETRKKVLWLY